MTWDWMITETGDYKTAEGQKKGLLSDQVSMKRISESNSTKHNISETVSS